MSENMVVEGILGTLDNTMKGLLSLQSSSLNGTTEIRIDNLIEEVSSVLDIIEPISKQSDILKNYAVELCKNMLCSLQKLKGLVLQDKTVTDGLLLKCECIAVLKMLIREIDFFYNKAVNNEGLKRYFEEEKRNLRDIYCSEKKDPEGDFPYDISIVVLFYNNKEITKLCIESIYEYTKDVNFELITVNNGSDEDTANWAETLQHSKKINLKYNIGASRGGTLALMPEISDGRFTVYLSNDVVVTKNWLTSLIECIKSDPQIAFASPVYNSASNRQTVPVNYTNIEEMQQFAEKYNHYNPLLWEDRARLFGIAMILRPWVLEKVGGLNDLYYSYDMFSDDDLCVKLNHAGYRMVLCRDTFVHHFGSATLKDGQFEVMEKGRRQFFDKYGFDSWGALGDRYDIFTEMLKNFNSEPIKVLAVNPRYGEEFLMLKNAFKSRNINDVSIDVFSMDDHFYRGLKSLSDRICYSESMKELEVFLRENKYSIIMLCEEAADCVEIESFLRIAERHLDSTGRIFLILDNMYSRNVFYNLMTKRNLSEDYAQKNLGRKVFISLKALLSFADSLNLTAAEIISLQTWYQRVEELEQPLSAVLQLDKTENINCFNTMYYAIAFELKQG